MSSTEAALPEADDAQLSGVERVKQLYKDLVGPAQATIFCAVIAFVPIWTEKITIDAFGETVCRYNDVTAFIFGMLGAAMGGLTLWHGRKASNRQINYLVGIVGLAFGVLHVARGLGWILGPCA